MEHRNNCLVCGKELEYLSNRESAACMFCREPSQVEVRCVDGHYICKKCHNSDGVGLIERYTIRTLHTDPVLMATELMRSSSIRLVGQEHHFLVPAVLLASYYNILFNQGNVSIRMEKEKKIREAKIRAEKVLGSFCGFYGACGAAIGTGIFVSLVTGATPISKQEWKLSNSMTSKSLECIAAAGGPRCCKRDTYLAILEAVQFIKKELNIDIPATTDVHCLFSGLNRDCLKAGCQFYE